MQKRIGYALIFLFLNFGALYLGNLLQGEGPFSDWYRNLNIAPWTPPGWVFGAAWTLIMICFSIYMGQIVEKLDWAKVIPLFSIQFLFNVAWNPLFFRFHLIAPALIILIGLTIVVGIILLRFKKEAGSTTMLLVPYMAWLFVAISLNAYALIMN